MSNAMERIGQECLLEWAGLVVCVCAGVDKCPFRVARSVGFKN